MRNHPVIIQIFLLLLLVVGCSEDKSTPQKDQNISPKLPRFAQKDPGLSGQVDFIAGKYTLEWTFKAEDAIKSTPAVLSNRILFGDLSGKFYAIDRKNGRNIFKKTFSTGFEASPLVINNIAYLGNLGGEFVALNAENGEVLWRFETGEQIYGTANFFDKSGQKQLIFGSYDFKAHALKLTDGKELWQVETGNYVNGSVAVAEKLKRAVFGGCDSFFRIIDLEKGSEVKAVDLGSYLPASPAIYQDFAYCGSHAGKIFAINLQNGAILWTYPKELEKGKRKYTQEDKELEKEKRKRVKSSKPFMASPAVNEQYVVAVDRDGNGHIIDRLTGKLVQNFKLRGDCENAPLISNDKIMTVDNDGWLSIFSLKTGKLIFEYECGVPLNKPALAGDELFLGDEDGNLYKFKAGN